MDGHAAMSGPGRWPQRGVRGGCYYPMDDDGFLVNDLDAVPMQEAWAGLVRDAVDGVVGALGPQLDGVYLRGSVAEGRAWDTTSDVDLIVVTTEPVAWTATDLIADLERRYAIAREVVVEVFDLAAVRTEERIRFLQVVLRAQSRFLHGTDRRPELPRVRPGWSMVFAAHTLEQRYAGFTRRSAEGPRDERSWRLATQAFFRAALRCGFELFEEDIGRYTRDLDLCAAVLAVAEPGTEVFDEVYASALREPREDDLALAAEYIAWYRRTYEARWRSETVGEQR